MMPPKTVDGKAVCSDCLTPAIAMYMVHDHLWAEAGMTPLGGFLCTGCLEHRLGRRLNASDFKSKPGGGQWGWRETLAFEAMRRREIRDATLGIHRCWDCPRKTERRREWQDDYECESCARYYARAVRNDKTRGERRISRGNAA